jgi:peroxiredoxin
MAKTTAERGVPVGTVAPTFSLPASDGSTVALEQFRSEQPVEVVFYRGWW